MEELLRKLLFIIERYFFVVEKCLILKQLYRL